jgi:hypothetical protein
LKKPSVKPPALKKSASPRTKALAVDALTSQDAAQALQEILQPFAKLMIDHQVQLSTVTDMLKQALVQSAIEHFALKERSTTDSRIAILTGVHRKDVRRLREEPEDLIANDLSSPNMSMAAQVVARWISDPSYLTAHNRARRLARTTKQAAPGEPDFTSLVAQVSKDIGARAILDELERMGVVHCDDENFVELRDNAFVPQQGLKESLHFLASNVSAHIATAAHNVSAQRTTEVMLEQSAFAQQLTAEDAAELQQTARQIWAQALQQFLQKATAAEQRSSRKANATQHVRFGVYFNTTQMPDAAVKPRAKTRK